MTKRDPINPTDDTARVLAQGLLAEARFGALAVTLDGVPYVSRVAVLSHEAQPYTLISQLSQHTTALLERPDFALLLGEPGPKGDPLTHPRLTIQGRAERADKAAMRENWLSARPKSALYYDFADFVLVRLAPVVVHLNGGFGKAYRLTPEDLSGAM